MGINLGEYIGEKHNNKKRKRLKTFFVCLLWISGDWGLEKERGCGIGLVEFGFPVGGGGSWWLLAD